MWSVMVAIMLFARTAHTSCECILITEAAEFSVHCYQTCGYADTGYSETDWRGVTDCHARALRFASNLLERLQHDPVLRRIARRTPLNFGRVYGWSDTLGLDDWQPPSGLPSETADSLLQVFREIDRDSSAILFTVQLGLFGKRSRAEALLQQLDDLRPSIDEGDPDLRDSTLTVDWRLSTCAYTVRPNLFICPTATESGPWRACYGLFIDRADATRIASRLRRSYKLSVVVQPLPFSRDLVQAAISQWHARGMTDTE
jgi:hypothetical protein